MFSSKRWPYHDVAASVASSLQSWGVWLSPPDALLPHWPMSPCLCYGDTLSLRLPPFLLQTLPLLPLSQLLLLPRLLRPMFVRQLLRRLAFLLPALCGLGTGTPPATEGKLQWLMVIEVM